MRPHETRPHETKPHETKPHVICVRLDSEGDVLLTGPAIRAVAGGASRVTLLCGPRGRAAAEILPGVDRLVVHRAAWIDPEPDRVSRSEIMSLVEEIAELDADQAIVFTSFHQSPLPTALVLRLAGVPFVAAISEDYPGSLLDIRHRIDGELHEVERALSLAAAAGYEPAAGDDGRLAVRAAKPPPVQPGSPYVVVHPGASVPARAWPAERHRALVDELRARGLHVVVTGGPSERRLTELVSGGARSGVLDLGGRTTLAELAGLLAGAEAVVVGNTGPAHLAAAVGVPVVSLFAPTVPSVRWRPWGVRADVFETPVPCAGCRARECPVPGHPCMTAIEPQQVANAVERLIAGADDHGPPVTESAAAGVEVTA